jgi:hypothetical protein
MERKIRVLFLAANPRDTPRLALDEEIRQIRGRIRGAELGHRIDVQTELALRPHELPAALMRHQPDLVHFSGHGTSDGSLCLVNDATGQTQALAAEELIALFKPLARDLRCVVLSACHSAAQAQAIVSCVPCVISMARAVKDDAATAFAAGFYEALAFGQSVQTAFDLGRAQMRRPAPVAPGESPASRSLRKDAPAELAPPRAEDIPRLLTRDGVDPRLLVLVPPAPTEAPAAPGGRGSGHLSQKFGNITITGSGNTARISQDDTFADGAAHSSGGGNRTQEFGDLAISGSGNVASITQNKR